MSEEKLKDAGDAGQTSPTVGDSPKAAKPNPGPQLVEISQEATLEIYAIPESPDGKPADAKPELLSTQQVKRGLFPLFEKLLSMVDEQTANHVAFAYLTAKDKDGNERKLKIVDARIKDAIEDLGKRIMPPLAVLEKLQLEISKFAEVSPLKGVILTAVLGDAQAAGFGFLSESIEVTDEDIKVLAESAANQVDMFKDNLREQKNIEFPGDSKIITPGQAGIFIP